MKAPPKRSPKGSTTKSQSRRPEREEKSVPLVQKAGKGSRPRAQEMKAPAEKASYEGRSESPVAESQLRRSTRKRTPKSAPSFYRGSVMCRNVKEYNFFTGKTPAAFRKVKSPSRVKKDDRRKSTSEMEILSKRAERKQLQSTPTKNKTRRSSLQPKKLF